ncbi:MAG: hypothetical protein RMJ56_10580 [Gemmataceae bacterium]|nr:hypothetical protein [Gemmata sp.]MDW8198035.1 hypothetical protein [Gemmataceae bacterium]
MSFLLPNPLPPAARSALPAATLAASRGYDDYSPVPTTVDITDSTLTLRRTHDESGYLIIPWPVEPFGMLAVSSATLRERDEPYRLLVELARGKLNQVRLQTAEWQELGLVTSTQYDRALAEATRLLGRAIHSANPTETDQLAATALQQAFQLADQLAHTYIEQLFASRHEEEGLLDTWFAARHRFAIADAKLERYTECFNAANVGFRWRDVQPHESHYDWTHADSAVAAAVAAGLPITLGPLIDLDPTALPEWTRRWEADLPTLAAFMCDYLETTIHRYKDEVQRWIICAGFNHADALGLIDDDRLRLAYRLFEAAAQVDSHLDLILSVAQPWGDYLRSEDQTITPLTFPDDLVRAGVRLAAVEVEIRLGASTRASLPRDLLDIARLLDVFGRLGPPLEVVLSIPSAAAATTSSAAWPLPPSPDQQARWGAAVAALALAWPRVRGLTWEHWSDADADLTPHSGLLDAAGQPKPLLTHFATLRAEHLQNL